MENLPLFVTQRPIAFRTGTFEFEIVACIYMNEGANNLYICCCRRYGYKMLAAFDILA